MALLKQLESLNQPAPEQFDDDDREDVTRARISSPLDDVQPDSTTTAAVSKLRRLNAPILGDLDARYRGRTAKRKDVFPTNLVDAPNDKLDDDESTSEDDGRSNDIIDDDIPSDESKTGETVDPPPIVSQQNDDQKNQQLKKAEAVRHQLHCWERVLAVRMRLQKVLKTAVQLPRDRQGRGETSLNEMLKAASPAVRNDFYTARNLLRDVMESLCAVHTQFLEANGKQQNREDDQEITSSDESDKEQDDESKQQSDGNEDDEMSDCSNDSAPSPDTPRNSSSQKRKRKTLEQHEMDLRKRQKMNVDQRNEILKKWHEKTTPVQQTKRTAANANPSDIVTQIDEILADRERLLKRTRVYRSECNRFMANTDVNQDNQDDEVVDDPEHFDDDDFYQMLLKDLIERKTNTGTGQGDGMTMTRQWLDLQKLRGKARKKRVDTRASKGRKLRYEIYKKMLNFMTPIDRSHWSDEAKSELFGALFVTN